ncbi:MAG: Gfo/Idh/MocA family oxidoreductase [Chloroflexi bacterium]|nr:Gfo/Idh/MocA family oxidoreductase [Chloroflexota bacterium]
MSISIAVVGAGHWHAGSIHAPNLQAAGATLIAASAGGGEGAEQFARQFGVPFYPDYRRMLDDVRPDFVLAMARHFDAPAVLAELVERGLPAIFEKPLGLRADDAREIVARARRQGQYIAVPLINRFSPVFDALADRQAMGQVGSVVHAHFRVINGLPERYAIDGVHWMLDPATAGPGCLLNLGIHAIDAFAWLVGEPIEVVSAVARTAGEIAAVRASGSIHPALPVYAAATLRSASGTVGTIEAGYTVASLAAGGDSEWRIAAEGAYLLDREGTLAITTPEVRTTTRQPSTTSRERYARFAEVALRRWQSGETPPIDLDDCLRAMEVIDRVAQAAGWTSPPPPSLTSGEVSR